MASKLKQAGMERILSTYSKALLLTRMRDDNFPIIALNERLGFERTGQKTSKGELRMSFGSGLFHERKSPLFQRDSLFITESLK
jgi:hypothetical protein